MFSLPLLYLNAIYGPISRSQFILSIPAPFAHSFVHIFLSHFSFLFLSFFFCLFSKCKLQLHTICIENRKFTQRTVCVEEEGGSEWVSFSIYFFRFFSLSLHLKSENSLQIQRQSRTDFHYRRILIVIQKCTHLYWAGFFLPGPLMCYLLACFSFILILFRSRGK